MGRRPRLSRPAVLDAALDLVDREGAEALTMRRLAADLGVEAMSLYGYVPNKDALLDGIVERLTAEVAIIPREDDWETWVRAQLGSLRDALMRHPRAVTIVAVRPVMSATTLALADAVLGELQAIGFTIEDANRLLWVFVAFVIGHALNQVAAMDRTSGPTPAERWASLADIDLTRYPAAVAAFGGEVWTPAVEREEFDFGVDLLLAGMRSRST